MNTRQRRSNPPLLRYECCVMRYDSSIELQYCLPYCFAIYEIAKQGYRYTYIHAFALNYMSQCHNVTEEYAYS